MKVQKFLKLFIVAITCVKLSACEEIPIISYTVENAVPFNGDNATTESANCKYDSIMNLRECEPGSKLDDDVIGGTIGLQQPLNTYEDFFAFGRTSDEPGILQFFFPSNYSDQINIFLYFFYEPNGRFKIGVPFISIETFDGVDLPFTFGQNSDLHPNDATIRNISLVVYIPPHISINGVYMSFTFPNNNPDDWFLLSEVDIFDFDFILFREEEFNSVVLGPDSLQSSVGFTCTVINSGSYEWYWEGNNGERVESTNDRHMFWVGAATRSSQLEINGLRYSDRGNYSCVVMNSRLNTTLHRRIFELTLNAEINVDPSKNTFPLGSTASIDCEIFGYIPGDIEWKRDGEVIQPVGIYTIAQSSGDSIDSISTDGVPISSRILTLGIKGFNETRAGQYTCGVVGDVETIEMNITLVVGEPVGPLEMIRNCINPDTLYALVGVNVVTASLQVIANIIYHECRRIKCKRKKWNFKKPKLPADQQQTSERKKPMLTRANAIDENQKKQPFLQRTDSFDLGTEERGMHLPDTNGSHSPFIKRLPFVNGSHGGNGGPLEEVRDSAFNIGRKLKENVDKLQIHEMADTIGQAAGPTAAAAILTGSVLAANNRGKDKSSSVEQQEDNKSGTLSLPVSQTSFRQESDDIFEEDHSLLPKGQQELPETSVHGFGQAVKTSWLGKKLQGRLPENQKEMIPMIVPSGIPVIFSGADDEEQKKQAQARSDDIPTSIGQELSKMVGKAKDLVPNAVLIGHAGNHETGEQGNSLTTQVTEELSGTIGGRVSPHISSGLPVSFVELNPTAWLKEKADHLGQGVGEMIDKVKGNQPAPVLNDGADSTGQKPTAPILHLPTSMPFQGEINKAVDKARELSSPIFNRAGGHNRSQLNQGLDGANVDTSSLENMGEELRDVGRNMSGSISQKLKPSWLKEKVEGFGQGVGELVQGKTVPHINEANQPLDTLSAGISFGGELKSMVGKAKAIASPILGRHVDSGSKLDEVLDGATNMPSLENIREELDGGKMSTSVSQKLKPSWFKEKVEEFGQEVGELVQGKTIPHSSEANQVLETSSVGIPFGGELKTMVGKAKAIASPILGHHVGSGSKLDEVLDGATIIPSLENIREELDPGKMSTPITQKLNPSWFKEKVEELSHGAGEIAMKMKESQSITLEDIKKNAVTDALSDTKETLLSAASTISSSLPTMVVPDSTAKLTDITLEDVKKNVAAVTDTLNDTKETLLSAAHTISSSVPTTIVPDSTTKLTNIVNETEKHISSALDTTVLEKSGQMIEEQKVSLSAQYQEVKDKGLNALKEINQTMAEDDGYTNTQDQADSPHPMTGDGENNHQPGHSLQQEDQDDHDVNNGTDEDEDQSDDHFEPSASFNVPTISVTDIDQQYEPPGNKRSSLGRRLKISQTNKPRLNKSMKSFHLEEIDLDSISQS